MPTRKRNRDASGDKVKDKATKDAPEEFTVDDVADEPTDESTDESVGVEPKVEVAPVVAVVKEASDITVMSGPFIVAGGNVVDSGGRKIAICGFDHNRPNSGPVIAGAVATALNRFYRTPLPKEPVKP